MRRGIFAEDPLEPFRELNQWVTVSQLQRKYRVSEIMPINDYVRVSEEADERRNGECGDRRRILDKEPLGRLGLVCETSP